MSELDKLAQEYIRTMDIKTSRYWTSCVIATVEYTLKPSEPAKNFFEKEFSHLRRQDEYYTIVGAPIGDSIETLSLKENENENKKNTDNSFPILNKYYIHAIIRHDELSAIQKLKYQANQQSEICKIPLFNFDGELNNLLLYTQFLKVEAIRLPIIKNQETKTVTQPVVNLAQWWNGVIEEGWQRLEEILTPKTFVLGGATRSISSPDTIRERGEVFDFGTLLNGKKFVLVVKMKHGTNQETNVLVQILSQTGDCLPQGLKLKITLNHNTLEGESETVIARSSDQIIQLEFSEPSNTLFKVEAIYQDAERIKEFTL